MTKFTREQNLKFMQECMENTLNRLNDHIAHILKDFKDEGVESLVHDDMEKIADGATGFVMLYGRFIEMRDSE